MNEQEIIALFAPQPLESLDDCSPLPGGEGWLVTTDSMVEGTHFRCDWSSAEQLAIKLFHINLSDLASSGAEPRWSLLNLGLPHHFAQDRDFLIRFAEELRQQCRNFSAPLLGGDTFRAPALFLSLTMAGQADNPIGRSGSRPGDELYISGPLGLSLAGLWHLEGRRLLEGTALDAALKKHLQPLVDLKRAQKISAHSGVRAVIDISDGLFIDAVNLSQAGQVGLEIELEAIPIAHPIATLYSAEEVLGSGEELELLFSGEAGLESLLPCHRIGRVAPPSAKGASVTWLQGGQERGLHLAAYNHF